MSTNTEKKPGKVVKLPNQSTALTVENKIEQVLMKGDLAPLSSEERVQYHNAVCKSLKLNPLTQPFLFITLNKKLVMYATRACTEQLRKINKVSIQELQVGIEEGVYVVRAKAIDGEGRTDVSTGAAPIAGLQGENKANMMMKAETKAKRRVTLSLCGLGILDETEVADIPASVKSKAVVVETVEDPEVAEMKAHKVQILELRKTLIKKYGDEEINQLCKDTVPECNGKSLKEYTMSELQRLRYALEDEPGRREGVATRSQEEDIDSKSDPAVEPEKAKDETPDSQVVDDTKLASEITFGLLNDAIRANGMRRFMAAKDEIAKGVEQNRLTEGQVKRIIFRIGEMVAKDTKVHTVNSESEPEAPNLFDGVKPEDEEQDEVPF